MMRQKKSIMPKTFNTSIGKSKLGFTGGGMTDVTEVKLMVGFTNCYL